MATTAAPVARSLAGQSLGNNSTFNNDGLMAKSNAEDAIWILSCTFIIFTMQSGFGLLESGLVSKKDEVNIMMKNAVDVIVGGLSFWLFGYAFSFGEDVPFMGGFTGGNCFMLRNNNATDAGTVYARFFFQSSFATTATTIVSGAMAERVKLPAYTLFSFINTIIYCFPAHWISSKDGWLRRLGMVDIAGGGPVHLLGGVTGLVATIMLKPRLGRFGNNAEQTSMACPTNALLGMFMLWWGWLGFNCGSTLGVSDLRWKLAARSAVNTTNAATGGGLLALLVSCITKNGKVDVSMFINGILGSLVSVTPFCALAYPWEGFVIGAMGAVVSLGGIAILEVLKVDDPVGCVGVHGFASMWGLIAVGLFTRKDDPLALLNFVPTGGGLFYTGNLHLLGVQLLGIVVIIVWTATTTFVFLKIIDLTIGLRVSPEDERLGADAVMHGLLDTEDSDYAQMYHARRKSSALHNEKTVWEDATNPSESGGVTSPTSTPSFTTTNFRRHNFLRRTFSHVMRQRECRFKPTTFSKSVQFDAPLPPCLEAVRLPVRRRFRSATMPSLWRCRRDAVALTEAERRGDTRELPLTPRLMSPTTPVNSCSPPVSNGQTSSQAVIVYI